MGKPHKRPHIHIRPGRPVERAAELHFETGASIYDSLFLALAEESNTIVATADGKLTKKLEGTEYARLALPLDAVARTIAGDS